MVLLTDSISSSMQLASTIAALFSMANIMARPLGSLMSDLAARKSEMRGRLWILWILQTLGGLFCIFLGRFNNPHIFITSMILFSIGTQATYGATFGIIPFVSHRSLGIVSGLTENCYWDHSDGGDDGGINGMLVYFPQWGGMVLKASKDMGKCNV
ncbi:hypothetical protein ACSBR2_002887 [Camellia fascicularis]